MRRMQLEELCEEVLFEGRLVELFGTELARKLMGYYNCIKSKVAYNCGDPRILINDIKRWAIVNRNKEIHDLLFSHDKPESILANIYQRLMHGY